MKEVNIKNWRLFLQNVEECCMYSTEEISALLNFYYKTRKEKERLVSKNEFWNG